MTEPSLLRQSKTSPEIIDLAVMPYLRHHLWWAVDHEGGVHINRIGCPS